MKLEMMIGCLAIAVSPLCAETILNENFDGQCGQFFA